MTQSYREIGYRVEDGVATVTLSRPESGNPLSMTMRAEIVGALRAAESDEAVAVAVIEGAGKSFCTGYDLKQPYGTSEQRHAQPGWVHDPNLQGWTDQFSRSCLRDWMTLWDLLKPVVVIVQGNCLGGGMEVVALADIAFVADNARLGYPPLRAMSTPDVPFFAWKLPMARAKYLQLTGNSVSGEQAADWGLVAKSFPAEELSERAWAEIRALAQVDSALLMANKHQVNQAYEIMGMRTHLMQSWTWHQLSGSVRPGHAEFFEIAKSDGLRAALDWMNGPFNQAGLE
jgi:enoyl-CoA hydratase